MNKLFTKVAALSFGLAMAIGVGVALGGQRKALSVKADDSTLTIDVSYFNTTSYAANNGEHTTGDITWVSNQVMKSSSDMQWQKNTGYIYNKTDLGTIKSVTVNSSAGSFTTYYGTEEHPTSDTTVGGGFFTVKVGGATGKTTSIVVVYDQGGTPATKYSVVDRVDNGTLSVSEVTEGSTLNCAIVPEDGYDLPETLTYVYMAGSPVDYTYTNGVVTVVNVQGNITIEAVCPKAPALRIQALYSKADGASVSDVYGIYVGKIDDSNIVMMDGEYGIDIYSKNAFATITYTENVTVLKVSGAISIYNGFYEVVPTSVTEAETVPEDQVPATPVVYAAKGGETAEYVSRLTTVTGTVTVAEGSQGNYDDDFDPDNKKDITMTFDLGGGKTLPVFYHRNSQTEEVYNAMKAAVTGRTEITVKGFTAWYKNAIQIKMNGYIPAAEGYTAEDFAQELLDLTDAVCTGYVEGDDNHDELVAIWSILAGADKYPSLAPEEKTILADAERDEHGSTVEQAMARYDFLTGKYNLSNFINGRTPVQLRPAIEFEAQNNTTMIIIVAIATVSAVSLAALLIIKKRKHN